MFNSEEVRILIDVVNKDLDITRLRILNDDDILENNYLITLQGIRNKLENNFIQFNVKDKKWVYGNYYSGPYWLIVYGLEVQ